MQPFHAKITNLKRTLIRGKGKAREFQGGKAPLEPPNLSLTSNQSPLQIRGLRVEWLDLYLATVDVWIEEDISDF